MTGLPHKITLSSYELEMPLRIEVERIITALQSGDGKQTPPELVADIEKNGLADDRRRRHAGWFG